ncbi:LysR family transcriptional regulator [Sorangium cellulosum]|uniref:LysR family transcriptional regulator n=1 Tax=Sorangium cellulosum TaxID=56 RepID=A0A2L0F613_SORCE|nr:LysR family transcriptional regulator [Sorangium cellulosum]AUX47015.1 LysR family transcriptional regulator [Sorangium cellulosum]
MSASYGRDLDLNLLRVFAVVADTGSVTAAASRLYLTQPAVSAALRRLTTTVGAPLFVRRGRGLALTGRGERLHATLSPHLQAIVDAALSEPHWSPATSERTVRLGLSDTTELWLLPALLRVLAREAPRMRVISLPVQFRTVAAALASGVDAAVSVADELPVTVRRHALFCGGFVCLFDPRHARLRRALTTEDYFALEHVIVSYNGDLRGIVEDVVQRPRKVRCSVSTFATLGALLDGSDLVATVPTYVAAHIRETRRHLATRPLPFTIEGSPTELLWPSSTDDDEACRFVRGKILDLARTALPKPKRA